MRDNELTPFMGVPFGYKFVVRQVELKQFASDDFPEMIIEGFLVPLSYDYPHTLFTLYPQGKE